MIGLLARPWPFTVASSTAFSAAFPALNCGNNYYGLVARTANGDAGAVNRVAIDLGFVRACNVLGVLWHNMRQTDTIRFYAYSDSGYQTVIYDSGTVSAITGFTQREIIGAWKQLLTLPNAVNAQYWVVELISQNTGNPAGYIQFSRVFIGQATQFAIGPQKATLSAVDRNATLTSEVGEVFSQEDPTLIKPVVGLSFTYAKQTEMELVLGVYTLTYGLSKPLLVCTDLTSSWLQDNLAFGRPQNVVQLESDTYDVWQFSATVTSIGP